MVTWWFFDWSHPRGDSAFLRRREDPTPNLLFFLSNTFQKQRIVLNIFVSCHGCGGYACSSPSLLLKQQQFCKFRVEILCFLFQDDLLQFPHDWGETLSRSPWLGRVVETGFYDPLDAMGFYCLCCWGDCGARGAGISRVLHGPSAEADMREKAKGKNIMKSGK